MQQTRSTKTKLEIENYLSLTPYPVTLNTIHHTVAEDIPSLAFSTVYRIVQSLEKQKKVIRTDWLERGSRYEWADRPHHHHVICEECGTVVDINDKLLNFNDTQVAQATGFTIRHHAIELFGCCKDCKN